MRSPHLAGRSAKFSNRHALLADAVGIQPLCAATLAEAALAFGIGAIARSLGAGGGYNLIDECGAVCFATHHSPTNAGSSNRRIWNSCGYGRRRLMRSALLWSSVTIGVSVMTRLPSARRRLRSHS
jgi:hypothetical protein